MSRKRKQSRAIRGRAMAGHHNAISIDDRKQFFDGLDHSAQRSSGRFVDHGIAAIGEKVAHDEHIARRQKNRDISVGVCRGLRQQAQLLCPDVQHDRRWARRALSDIGAKRPFHARRRTSVLGKSGRAADIAALTVLTPSGPQRAQNGYTSNTRLAMSFRTRAFRPGRS